MWATGGDDGEGGGAGPAILLCHGFGAPGDDLVSLARVIDVDRSVRWFFPEAPLTMDFGMGAKGRAWWPIDMERMMSAASVGLVTALANETPDGLKKARAALEGTLDALEAEHDVRRDRLIIGGFSQGAMITTEVALFAHARPFAGLAILSGALISKDRWEEAAARSGKGLVAIQSHGKRDPILPFGTGEALRDMLTSHGAKVTFVEHNGAHEIPNASLDALARLAKERLASAV